MCAREVSIGTAWRKTVKADSAVEIERPRSAAVVPSAALNLVVLGVALVRAGECVARLLEAAWLQMSRVKLRSEDVAKRAHGERPNDPSSATRRTGRTDCNHDAPAGFAAALG